SQTRRRCTKRLFRAGLGLHDAALDGPLRRLTRTERRGNIATTKSARGNSCGSREAVEAGRYGLARAAKRRPRRTAEGSKKETVARRYHVPAGTNRGHGGR